MDNEKKQQQNEQTNEEGGREEGRKKGKEKTTGIHTERKPKRESFSLVSGWHARELLYSFFDRVVLFCFRNQMCVCVCVDVCVRVQNKKRTKARDRRC